MQYSAKFSSHLNASQEEVWQWMTSLDGVTREMSPLLLMTSPEGVKSLDAVSFEPGTPIFRSWLLLFTLIPVDYSNVTLERVDEGSGFVEQSSMGSMRLWRHVRTIQPRQQGSVLIDELTFEPRFAGFGFIANKVVQFLFKHRHKQLRKYLGSA